MKLKQINLKDLLRTLIIIIAIMSCSLIISFLFRWINFHESNIIIIFILGVLFVSRYTNGHLGGVLASIIGVTLFNFFFTEPYFTLQANRSDYPITFIIMLIAALVTSTSTTLMKEKMRESNAREKNIQLLYSVSQSIMKSQSASQAIESCGDILSSAIHKNVFICLKDDSNQWKIPKLFTVTDEPELDSIHQQMLQNEFISNSSSFLINNGKYHIEFIETQDRQWGVMGIEHGDKEDYSDEEKHILKSISLQIGLTIEREYWSMKQAETKIASEKNHVRANLLRSISHDLRSPLTGILGSISMLIDKKGEIDESVSDELIKIVLDDTHWLINTVENILSMTKIDEKNIGLSLSTEIVEEIIENAIVRINRNHKNVEIRVILPHDIIEVDVDSILMSQVFMNLIDNAIKYGDGLTKGIDIMVSETASQVVFEVTDHGKGIPAKNIPYIFDAFYTTDNQNQTERRGIGLGLPICKSIIELHHGTIYAFNNVNGGTTIRFTVPKRGEK